MTKEHVYIFEKAKLSRSYRIIDAIAVIKSQMSKEVVFVFQSNQEKDFRF